MNLFSRKLFACRPCRIAFIAGALGLVLSGPVIAASSSPAPPLAPPPTTDTVVTVATEAQLQNAVQAAASHATIVIAPGTYNLTNTLYFNGVTDVTLRGATGNRDDVVLVGKGMTNASYGAVPHGISITAQRVTVADLTIREVYGNAIILGAGAESPHIYNVHLLNSGQQFIKANPDGAGGGVDNGIVEYSLIEYTSTSRDSDTNGIEVLTGTGWAVRNNMFGNITAPGGQLAGAAVLFWTGSRDATVEGNTFINCQREVALGVQRRSPDDNQGGIVRNNFIYRSAGITGDAAISVADSPDTQVLHNTALLNNSYPNAIEYRFGGTVRVVIANNLVSGQILARNGASGNVSSNYLNASASMFVNAAAGDLHLKSSATAVIDKVNVMSNAAADWDLQTRPMGTSADYGADEYAPTATPAPSNKPPTVAITSPTAGTGFTAPATINIAATASDSDGTIARIDFLAGGNVVGSDSSSPYTFSWTNVGVGAFGLTAVAYDNQGASTTSVAVTVNVSGSPSGSVLPSSWNSIDIGSPALAGSATYAGSTFTVKGAGVDIWNTSDQFQFVYQPLAGDGQIVARVASLTNTNPWSKAGVLIRSTLTANSPYAYALVSAANGVEFQQRTTTGGTATRVIGPAQPAPYWVKLVRAGSLFSAYSSSNGTTWTAMGSSTIAMGSSVYVGLAVTSHTTSALATATFSGVVVTPGTGGTPPPPPPPPTNLPPIVAITGPTSGTGYTAPASINITATASDPDGTIARVDFLAGSNVIGSDSSSPFSFSWANVGAGNFSLTAVAYDNQGGSTTSAAVPVTVSGSSSGSTLPAPWSSTDIGSPALAGSATYANIMFTVKGGGVDIWNSSDQFQFVSQPLSGDGQIVARVASLTNTDPWTKAGVMVRSSLTANSAYAYALVSAANGVEFQQRNSTGATSTRMTGPAQPAPYWVKLARAGSLLSAYSSADGATWTLIGSSTIATGSTVYVGLAVTSHTPSALATATFSGVAVTAGSGTTNQLPVASITAPAAGAAFTAPATIALTASATDADGSISRVDFYSGTTLLGSDTSSPYTLSWTNVAAGSYTLKAIAVDNTGASTTSAPVTITVNPSGSAPPTTTTVAFTPSSDNSTNVTSYRLELFVAGANPATATPVASQSLGMPPISNGDMSANIQQLVNTLPPGSYFGTVTAIGPGGTTRSAPSNTFTH